MAHSFPHQALEVRGKKVLSRGKCGAVEPFEPAIECCRGRMFRLALYDLWWMLHPFLA